MHTLNTIKMTNNSYNKAIKEIDELCKGAQLDLHGSGYSHRIGDEFDIRGYNKSLIKYATEIYSTRDSIMEWDRPKIIQKSFWVYRDSYLKIQFIIEKRYFNYRWDDNKIKKNQNSIYFYFYNFSTGIHNFSKNKKELLELTKECNNNIKKEIKLILNNASQELKKWKEAINNLKTF